MAADLELNILKFKEYARQRDYKNADRIGRALVKQHYTNKQVMEMVGNIFANLNMLDQAEEVFLILVSAESKHPLYNFFLGFFFQFSYILFEMSSNCAIFVDLFR